MADFHDLELRYEKIPQEMKSMRNWVCFRSVTRNNKKIKLPISPNSEKGTLSGASSNDKTTWADFQDALRFCYENSLDGLGFELGESGMFGVDISRTRADGTTVPEADFQDMSNDFVKSLNSYTEWSVSKNGIHIICYGKVPEGIKSVDNIEIYDSQRYFAMTGNAIGSRTPKNRSEELRVLWAKYSSRGNRKTAQNGNGEVDLGSSTDEQVLSAALSSKNGPKIRKLMDGLTDDYESKEKAIIGLCSFIAYFSKGDEEQVDRIFRKSALYGPEWDEPESNRTHGYFVVQNAVEACAALHLSAKQNAPSLKIPNQQNMGEMNLDADGNPIFRISEKYHKNKKNYPLNDTGNAMRFYDCFGENFHWDTKMKMFMFWTGKTWVYDSKEIVRRYANRLIDLLSDEVEQIRHALADESDEAKRKTLDATLKNFSANVKHLSSKSGKDAMLAEFKSLGNIPAEPTEFNNDPLRINTESGIVDLETGAILPFDRNAMFSSNTKVEVSFDTPTVWLKFLDDIFEGNKDIIECYQRCVGYTLTGLTSEQVMFILYGDGSNGKSTQSGVMEKIMGDYYGAIDPSQLMVKDNQSAVAVQNSFAEQIDTRYLITQETEKGARLSESTVKQCTGSTPINAQKKYGNPFRYTPKFKVWMETNNLPYITGGDYGIWRRIFLFPFKRQFKDEEKDKDMPAKLAAEYPKILGWAIQGAVKYLADGKDLKQPDILKMEVANFKAKNDGIAKFITSECRIVENGMINKTEMYQAYRKWAMDNKEHTYPESKFREELIKKGFKVEKNELSGIMSYIGISLNYDIDDYVKHNQVKYQREKGF